VTRVKIEARRYIVRGRVQGVGFRAFVQRKAVELGIRGYTRNLSDGGVEVYAVGLADQLSALEGPLWKGPMFSRVDHVEAEPAQPGNPDGFSIRR
jgi:acylphosphatase